MMEEQEKENRICIDCGLELPIKVFHKQCIKGKYYYQKRCNYCRRRWEIATGSRVGHTRENQTKNTNLRLANAPKEVQEEKYNTIPDWVVRNLSKYGNAALNESTYRKIEVRELEKLAKKRLSVINVSLTKDNSLYILTLEKIER